MRCRKAVGWAWDEMTSPRGFSKRSRLAIAVVCCSALGLSLLLSSSRRNAWRGASVEDPQHAAQVAFFVLRLTVEGAASTRQYAVVPSLAPLSSDEAGRALATLKKPARCAARMEGAVLVIACHALSQADSAEHLRRAGAHIAALAADLRERCSEPVGRVTLQLRRRGIAMTVPFDAVEQWLRDYDMDFSLEASNQPRRPRVSAQFSRFGRARQSRSRIRPARIAPRNVQRSARRGPAEERAPSALPTNT
jgi:hypothetical protein